MGFGGERQVVEIMGRGNLGEEVRGGIGETGNPGMRKRAVREGLEERNKGSVAKDMAKKKWQEAEEGKGSKGRRVKGGSKRGAGRGD